MKKNSQISRRRFLENSTIAAMSTLGVPNVIAASKSSSQIIVGEGVHQFEVLHNWARLPDRFSWQTTHNVSVDREGLLYVIHEGTENLKDHPAIFVFDPRGEYVRSFGSQFQGGGHGLEVRTEGAVQFLYVTGYQGLKFFAKLTLTGETVWERHAPMESKIYANDEDTNPKKVWGRDRFMPTNIAFRPDGGFYVADGYGAYQVHQYDKDANWVSVFGGVGQENGQFQLPHGIWMDNRPGRELSIVVADRVNARLQWFTLEGKHLKTLDGFVLPANVDTYKEMMVVPDLSARVTLVDGNDRIVAHLGEDPEWRAEVLKDNRKLRQQPDRWVSGKFLHPHDACFDADGNIFVAEWVQTGRITKLRRLS